MNKKYNCKICNKEVTANNSYVGSHVKRKHSILLEDYFLKYETGFTDLNLKFKKEKCNFCKKEIAKHIFKVDYNKQTFIRYYDGNFCYIIDCKENISKKLFDENYNPKKFEHIGSNSTFLSIKYNKSIQDVIFDKSKGFREMKFTTSLDNYIKKYGLIKGTKKYNDRCNKISKANTKKWYLEKYGKIGGLKKWDIFRKKKHKGLGPSLSKSSKKIETILLDSSIFFIPEYKYENEKRNIGSIDYFLPDSNIIIEFYGDYWHCNPNIYSKTYYHKIMKSFAFDVWEKDYKRINYIYENEFNKNVTILIIWESTKFTSEYLINKIKEIKNLNTIIEI